MGGAVGRERWKGRGEKEEGVAKGAHAVSVWACIFSEVSLRLSKGSVAVTSDPLRRCYLIFCSNYHLSLIPTPKTLSSLGTALKPGPRTPRKPHFRVVGALCLPWVWTRPARPVCLLSLERWGWGVRGRRGQSCAREDPTLAQVSQRKALRLMGPAADTAFGCGLMTSKKIIFQFIVHAQDG